MKKVLIFILSTLSILGQGQDIRRGGSSGSGGGNFTNGVTANPALTSTFIPRADSSGTNLVNSSLSQSGTTNINNSGNISANGLNITNFINLSGVTPGSYLRIDSNGYITNSVRITPVGTTNISILGTLVVDSITATNNIAAATITATNGIFTPFLTPGAFVKMDATSGTLTNVTRLQTVGTTNLSLMGDLTLANLIATNSITVGNVNLTNTYTGMLDVAGALRLTGTIGSGTGHFRTDSSLEVSRVYSGGNGALISIFNATSPADVTSEGAFAFGGFDSAGTPQKTAAIDSKWLDKTAATGNSLMRLKVVTGGGTLNDVFMRAFGGLGLAIYGTSETVGPGLNNVSIGNSHLGLLGIGTTAPLVPLHVWNDNPSMYFDDSSTTGTKKRTRLIVGDTSTNQGITIAFSNIDSTSTGNTNVVTISELGRMGVITTAPSNTFSVGATSQFQVSSTGDIIQLAGSTYSITSGTNQRAGDAVLVGGTVDINNTTITANTKVFISRKVAGGTVGTYTYTLSAGSKATITSSSVIDTSTLSYFMIEVP